MTKTNLLTALGGGDHVADLHLISRDNDTINQQLNHLSFLLKGRIRSSLRDTLTEDFDGLDHGRELVMALDIYLQVAHLPSKRLQSLL